MWWCTPVVPATQEAEVGESLEFSVDELKHLRKTALVGGGIQMFICTAAFGLGFITPQAWT